MGKRLDLSQLSEEECEQILKVIQKDFELRQKDKSRIENAEAELQEEKTKESILLRQKDFNDDFCLRCCGRFIFLINSKQQCNVCHYNVCKDCCTPDKVTKKLTCSLCAKQLAFEKENGEWFYSSVKNRFKHFGSAKVVRTLYKQKTESDAEYESASETGTPSGKKSRSDKLSLSQTDSKVLAVQEAIEPMINAESSKLQLYLTAIASTVQRIYVDSDKTEEIQQQRKLLVSSMDDFKSSLWRAANKSEALSTMTPADKDLAIEVLLSQEVAKFLALEDNILLDDSRSHPEQLADEIVKAAISDKRGSKSSYSGPADQAVAVESILEDSAFADNTEAEGGPTDSDRDLQGEVAAVLVLQEAAHQHRDEDREAGKKHRKQPHLSEGEGDAGDVHTKQPRLSEGVSDEDADFFEVEIEPKAEITAEDVHSAPSAFIVSHSDAPSEDFTKVHGDKSPVQYSNKVLPDHNDISHHHQHPPQQLSVSDEETITKVILEIDENPDSTAGKGEDFVMVEKHHDSATAAALAAAVDDETEIIEDKTREGSPTSVHVSHHEHSVHKSGATSPTTENAVDEVHHDIVPESLSDHINYSEHDDFAIYYVVTTDKDADGTVNVELGPADVIRPSSNNVIDELHPAGAARGIVDDHVNNNERGDLADYDIIAAGRERDRSLAHHRQVQEVNDREELVFADAAAVAHHEPSHHEHTPSSHETRMEINIESQGEGDADEQEVPLDVTPIVIEEHTYEHAPHLQFDMHPPHLEHDHIDTLEGEPTLYDNSPTKGSAAFAEFPSLDDTHQSAGGREGFNESLYDNIPADDVGKAYDNAQYYLGTSEDNAYELHEHNCNTPELQLESDFKSRDTDIDKVSLTTNEGIYEDLMDIVRTHEDDSEHSSRHLPSLADNGATIGVSSPASEDVFSSEMKVDFKDHGYENLPPQVEIIVGLPHGAGDHADNVYIVEITEIEGKIMIPTDMKSELAEHHVVLPAVVELEPHAKDDVSATDGLRAKYTAEFDVSLDGKDNIKDHTYENLPPVEIIVGLPHTDHAVDDAYVVEITEIEGKVQIPATMKSEIAEHHAVLPAAAELEPHAGHDANVDTLDEKYTTEVVLLPKSATKELHAKEDDALQRVDIEIDDLLASNNLEANALLSSPSRDELMEIEELHLRNDTTMPELWQPNVGSASPHTPPSTPADDLEMTYDGARHEDMPHNKETFTTQVFASLPHSLELPTSSDGEIKPGDEVTFVIPLVAQDRLEDELPHTPVPPVTHSTQHFPQFESASVPRVDDEKIIVVPADFDLKVVPLENGHDDDDSVVITEVFEMEGKVFLPSDQSEPVSAAVITDDKVRDLENRLKIVGNELRSVGDRQDDDSIIIESIGNTPNGHINAEIGTEKETNGAEVVTEVYEMEGKVQIPPREDDVDGRVEVLPVTDDKSVVVLPVEDDDRIVVHPVNGTTDVLLAGDKAIREGIDDEIFAEELPGWSNHFVEVSELEGKLLVPRNVYSEQVVAEALLLDVGKVNGKFSPEEQDALFVKIERAHSDIVPSPNDDTDGRKLDDKHWKTIENDRSISELWHIVETVRSDYWSESPSKADPSVDEFSPLSLLSDEEADELFEQIERGLTDSEADVSHHRSTTGDNDGEDENEVVDIQIKEIHREVVHSALPVWPGFDATHPHAPVKQVETHKTVYDEDPDLSEEERFHSGDDVTPARHPQISDHEHYTDEEGEIVDLEIREVHKEVVHSALPVWPTFDSTSSRGPAKPEPHATIHVSDNLSAEEEADPKNGYSDSFGDEAVANSDIDESEIVEIVQIRQVHREVVHSTPVWPGFESTQPQAKPEERVRILDDDLDESNGLLDSEKLQHESYSDNEAVADELHVQMAEVSEDEPSSDENEIIDVQINQTHRQAPASILTWPDYEPVQSNRSNPTVRLEPEKFMLNSNDAVNNQPHASKPVPLISRSDSDISVGEPVIRKQANIREIVLPELDDCDEEAERLENGHPLDDDTDLRDDETLSPYAGVSVPSFAEGEPKDPDLDDFTNNNVDKDTSTDDITFKSHFRKDIFHEISPYDNFSVRKVGTNDRPVYMLIPTTSHGVKIGNKDADDISELDENENHSDLSDDSETGDSDGAGRLRSGSKHKKRKTARRTKSLTTDSACQTDDLNLSVNKDGYLADVSLLTAGNDVPVVVAVSVDDKLLHSIAHLTPVSASVRTRHEQDDDDNESFADPRFTVRPANVTVAEGELATFTCEITGTVPADVFWYRDADELKSLDSDDRVQPASNSEGRVHQLEMFNVNKSDAGYYLCIAVSAAGKRTKRFQLLVTDNVGEKRAPQILRPLANVEAVHDEDVTFTCKISAYPQPLVHWYKDGKRVEPSDRIHTRKVGNRDYELTLQDVTFNDDAEYMIVVTNIAGVTKSNAQLTVSEAKPLPEVVMRENVEIQALPPAIIVTPAQAPAPAPSADSELYPAVEKLMEIASMGTELHVKEQASPPKASKVERQPKDDLAVRKQKSSKPRNQRPKSEGFSWQPASQLRDEMPSPEEMEVRTEEDEVELKVSYADYARLYDSGLITSSQLRRGRVRQSDILPIQAFLNHSTSGNAVQGSLSPQQQRLPSASQGQLVLDLPVVEMTAAERSPKRADKHMFDRDFIVDDSKSRSKRPHSVSTSPVKQVTRVDVQQLPPPQPQQHIIMCNIQDTVRFQLQGNADIPASQEGINVKSPFPDAEGLAEVDVKNLRYKWERLVSNDDSDPSPDGKRMRTQQTIRSTLQQARAQQQPKPVSTSSLHINVHDNNTRRVLSSSSAAQVYSSPEATRYHSLPSVYNTPVNSLQQPQPHLDIKIKPSTNKVHQVAPAQFRNSLNVMPRNDGYRSMPDDHRQQSLPRYNDSGKRDGLYRNDQQPVMQLHRQPIEDTVSAPSPNVKELRMKFGSDSYNGQKPRRKGRRPRRNHVASERLHLQITHVSSDSDANVHSLTARSFAASNNHPQNSLFPGQTREVDYRRLPRS